MTVSLALNRTPEVVRAFRITDQAIASLKQVPEDFVVEEIWQPQFSGDGEHLYLFIEKIGQNTPWVAKQLSKSFGVSEKTVGYSGLKDRQAVTRQWFSLPVPAQRAKKDPVIEGVRILQKARHSGKLRRGSHLGNSFQIRLRDLDADRVQLISRLGAVSEQGFPNYFGPQRFGHNGNNLRAGRQLAKARKLVGHPKRGFYLSAMRSSLFNQVLAAQMRAGNWSEIVDFYVPATGPMWGRGRPLSAEMGVDIENQVVADNAELCDLLEHGGLSQERRLLRQCPENFSWSFIEREAEGGLEREVEGKQQDLLLRFSLPPGSYATVLIDELLAIRPDAKEKATS